MSVVLVGTTASVHRSVRHAFSGLIRSEALALVGTVRDRVRLANRDVTAGDLDELLEEQTTAACATLRSATAC